MKKPAFIITEVIFSLLLTASVSAIGVLVYDLNTNALHLNGVNPFTQQTAVITEESEKPSQEPSKASKAETSVESKASETEKQVSEPSAEESKEPVIQLRKEPENLQEQPAELEEALSLYGYTIEGFVLGDRLIWVDTTSSDNHSKAKIYCYQKSDSGYWWDVVGDKKALCEEAYIGENGSNFDPAPDSKITPGGIFTAGQGFYIGAKPDTAYPMFEITEDTYWVTDPDSQFYNQRVEGTDSKDWSKADHMITSDKSYRCGLTVNYNTAEPSSDKAAAVFIRCGNTPTEGSIAVPEDVMKTILHWLEEDSTVTVFINV